MGEGESENDDLKRMSWLFKETLKGNPQTGMALD